MKRYVAILLLAISALGTDVSAVTIDVVQTPTDYFLPGATDPYSTPWYRRALEDWDWQHSAIGGTITYAELTITAFDVDYDFGPGERDQILAKDDGTWTALGFLQGVDDSYSDTTFVLGPSFYNDIAGGLEVMIDISYPGPIAYDWGVTLIKSVLLVDSNSTPPPPPPPPPHSNPSIPVPEARCRFKGGAIP